MRKYMQRALLLTIIGILGIGSSAHAGGSFTVEANNPGGFRFYNPSDSNTTYKCDFFSIGRWTYNPNVGYHGANGHPRYQRADSGYRLAGVPEGSLIVRFNGKDYFYVGNGNDFYLSPGDSLRFMINDSSGGGSFSDNRGQIKVEWDCEKY